jgi:hypothetical protein
VTVLAIATLLVAVPKVAYAERTIGLSSGSFAFTVDPGQVGQGEVIVMNDGDEPLKALVYIADVQISDTGEQTYVTPQREGASLLTTPASWFRIYMPADSKSVGNTPYLELDVGERVPISFEFSAPSGTPPGDHNTIIFFEMFDLAEGGDGMAAQVAGRLGARVALRVTGQVVEKMTIRPFEVPGFVIGTDIPFRFRVNNEGNLNKRIEVTAAVLSRSEQAVVNSVVATDTAVYANSSREFTGVLDTVSARLGPHTVEVRTTYLEDGAQIPSELIEERTVWIVPLWAVALVGFLLLYAFGYLAYRVFRRRPRGASAAPASRDAAHHRTRDLEVEDRRRRREERASRVPEAVEEPGLRDAAEQD